MALLILLRVEERGRPVPRTALPRRLWVETGTDAATLTRNALNEIRDQLGDAIESQPNLLIDPGAVECDLDELTLLLDSRAADDVSDGGLADRVDRVLALYRGEPFEGWTRQTLQPPGPPKPGTVSYGAPFTEWIESTRTAIRGRVREYLIDAAERVAAGGAWSRVRHITAHLRRTMREVGVADARIWPLEIEAATAIGALTEAEAIYQAFLRANVDAPPAVQHRIDALRARPTRSIPVAAESIGAVTDGCVPTPSVGGVGGNDALGLAPAPARAGPNGGWRWKGGAVPTAAAAAVVLAAVVAVARFARGGRRGAADATGAANPCTAATARATLIRHNYQLGAVLKPGRRFTKGWWLWNQGECLLGPGLRLRFAGDGGTPLSGSRADIPISGSAPPGKELLVEVPMRAPAAQGVAEEQWALVDSAGKHVPINGAEQALLAQVRVLREAPSCQPGEASAIVVATSHLPNQTLTAGQPFVGAWATRNDGRCIWPPGMRLVPASPQVLSGTAPALTSDRAVGVGDIYTFRVDMRTPERPDHYREAWQLVDPFGQHISVGGDPAVALRIASVPATELSSQTALPPCGKDETRVGWVGESPEDSAAFAPGAPFRKTWTVVNTGRCRWERLYLRFRGTSGARMSATDEVGLSGAVYPTALYNFDLPMHAPRTPGVYRETWELRDAFGDPVRVTRSDTVWVIVRVPAR